MIFILGAFKLEKCIKSNKIDKTVDIIGRAVLPNGKGVYSNAQIFLLSNTGNIQFTKTDGTFTFEGILYEDDQLTLEFGLIPEGETEWLTRTWVSSIPKAGRKLDLKTVVFKSNNTQKEKEHPPDAPKKEATKVKKSISDSPVKLPEIKEIFTTIVRYPEGVDKTSISISPKAEIIVGPIVCEVNAPKGNYILQLETNKGTWEVEFSSDISNIYGDQFKQIKIK